MGVKIDETLSGAGILDTVVKKCTGRLKFLYRQAGCLLTALKTLCQSLVQSHLDYAISSWYAAMTQRAKNKLQITHSKIIRFILDLEPRTHNWTRDRTKHAKNIRKSATTKTKHSTQNILRQAPTHLQSHLKQARDRTQHTKGSKWSFVVPNVKG